MSGAGSQEPAAEGEDASPSLEPGALSRPLGEALRKPLPPWSAQAFGVLIGLVLLAWGALGWLGHVRYLVGLAVISTFLYFALAPAVDWLVAHKVKRGLASALVILGLIAGVMLLGVAMVPLVVHEVQLAITDGPALLARLRDLAAHMGVSIDLPSNSQGLRKLLAELQGHMPAVANGALSVTSTVADGIFKFFITLMLTFFLLAGQDRFRRFVLSFMRPSTQTVFGQAWDIAVLKTGGYLYSRLLMSLLAGVLVAVTLSLLDCPYPVALGLWYGIVSQFLPMIGTYLAAALPLVILLTDEPLHALIFVLVLAVWVPFQDYVISPRISARTMELAPAAAVISLLVGAALFGPLGAFLALPATAVLQSVGTAFFPRHEVVESAAARMPTQ